MADVNVIALLSNSQKEALAKQALEVAGKHGYCEETKNVLRDLGLPVKDTKQITYNVDLTFELPNNGHIIFTSDLLSRLSYHSQSGLASLVGAKVNN